MSEDERDANRIMALATGYWSAGALNTAVCLGVFDALSEEMRVEDLAQQLNLNVPALENLVHALAGLGMLTLCGGRVAIPEPLKPWLSPETGTSLLDAMRYNADLFRLWGDLPGCVASGKPAGPIAQLGRDPEMTERFVKGMESRGRWLAPQLVPDLPVPQKGRVLDLACGSGVFTRTLLETREGLEVTLFDLPDVLGWTRRIWREAGVEGGCFVEGDYRKDELPVGADFILYAGALHQESAPGAKALFAKVNRSLGAGGVFCVVDIMLTDDVEASVFGHLFSLNMRLLQPEGHVFSVGEVEDLLQLSGFSSVEVLPPARHPYRILAARV